MIRAATRGRSAAHSSLSLSCVPLRRRTCLKPTRTTTRPPPPTRRRVWRQSPSKWTRAAPSSRAPACRVPAGEPSSLEQMARSCVGDETTCEYTVRIVDPRDVVDPKIFISEVGPCTLGYTGATTETVEEYLDSSTKRGRHARQKLRLVDQGPTVSAAPASQHVLLILRPRIDLNHSRSCLRMLGSQFGFPGFGLHTTTTPEGEVMRATYMGFMDDLGLGTRDENMYGCIYEAGVGSAPQHKDKKVPIFRARC